MSTMETSLKTNSALSDLVKNFLQGFKDKENSFKYVEQIDLMRPKNSKYIVVDFNDLVLERSIVLGITENPDVILNAFSRAIKEILQQRFPKYAEKIKVDDKGIAAIYDYCEGDLRHAINILQATASLGDITEENVKASAGLTKTKDVDGVLKLALDGKISDARNKMIELIKVYGMSESDFLKYINSAVFKTKTDNLSEILQIIAKYDYRVLSGANPEIQLSALLAELGQFKK